MNDNLDYLAKYRDPLKIQIDHINNIQDKITNGAKLVSANNVATFLIEMNAYMAAHLVNETCNVIPPLYPSRVETSEDLYKHIADNEYLGMFSSPSSFTLGMYLDKQYLINNAIPFNDDYNKIVIPKESLFVIEQFYFGLYYPIEIRINKNTNTFHISYDTKTYGLNPLHQLHQNTIPHRFQNIGGLELLSFEFPLYQFKTITSIEELVPESGFVKNYDFEDTFYAIRVYNWVNNKWEEIEKTFSDKMYDTRTVTAKITVRNELNRLQVRIPQVYFTENKMGTRLKVEILSTLGYIDADISDVKIDNISHRLKSTNPVIQKYANIFNTLKTLDVYPTSSKILGGSNGYDLDEAIQRVKNNSFYGKVLISPEDAKKWLEDKGFGLIKYRDGITDRIYYCIKRFTDNTGDVIPSANIVTKYTKENLIDINTIISNYDGSYTILPNTLYRYDAKNNICTLVSNKDVKRINSLNKEETIKEFNENIYTLSKLHTRLDINPRYPYAISYDLDNPKVKQINFIEENINLSTQLTIISAQIIALSNYEGYRVEMLVSRTNDIKELKPKFIKVYVSTMTSSNHRVCIEAEYITTDKETDLDMYHIDLSSNYVITSEHEIYLTKLKTWTDHQSYPVSLNFDLDVIFLVHKEVLNTDKSMPGNMRDKLPPNTYDNYYAVAEQELEIDLGQLVTAVFNKTDLSYTDKVYAKYEKTEYAYYTGDVLQTDENNLPYYDRNSSTIGTVKLSYKKGSNIVDSEDIKRLEAGMYIHSMDFPFYTFIERITYDEKLGQCIILNHEALTDGEKVETNIGQVEVTLYYNHRLGDWIFNANAKRTFASTVLGTKDITVDDITDVKKGMKISGEGISPTTTIVDVNINEKLITMDKPSLLTLENAKVVIGIPSVLHKEGDIIIKKGQPVLKEDRKEIFYMDKIQIDSKLFKTFGLNTIDYSKIISDTMRDYCKITNEIKSQLAENPKVYYRPLQSLGYSDFIVDSNKKQSMSLEMIAELKLHVYDTVYRDADLLEIIRKQCIIIVEKHLSYTEISMEAMAEEIRLSLIDYVKYVDILGINENVELQTLVSVKEGIHPILKRKLALDESDNIIIQKDLRITFIPITK